MNTHNIISKHRRSARRSARVLAALCLFAAHRSAGQLMLNQGFNSSTWPAGWFRTTLANTGGDVTPAISLVTASSYPSAAPFEGSHFVKFNSYNSYPGTSIRLWYSNGFSTIGYGRVLVRCAWFQFSGPYSKEGEGAWLRWSTNAVDWEALAFFPNFASPTNWHQKELLLPAACLHQPRVCLAFDFVSAYGYNCYLDAVQVTGLAPNVYFTPDVSRAAGAARTRAPHALAIENSTPSATVYHLSYESAWLASGPASIALDAGQSSNIIVYTAIPADASDGAACTGRVTAVAGGAAFSNSASLVTACEWFDFTDPLFYEPFDEWPHGWTTYQFASTQANWAQHHSAGYDDNGLAPPCAFHTNFIGATSTNWLVSPPIPTASPLSGLLLSFFHGQLVSQWYRKTYVMLSTGAAHPASGAYTQILEIGQQLPYWYKQFVDLSAFAAAPTVHLAFVYLGLNGHQQMIDSVAVMGYERRAEPGLDELRLALTNSLSVYSYQTTAVITAELFKEHATGMDGPLSNMQVETGYGPRGTLPDDTWHWAPAVYLGPSGSNDLYGAALFITVSDDFDLACRARPRDGSWVYGDCDGSANGYLPQQAGALAVLTPPPHGGLLQHQYFTNDYNIGPGSCADPSNAPTLFILSADDVTLPYDAEIRSLRWAGLYWGGGRSGHERGFWLRMHAGGGATPGALLYEEYVPGYACERSAGGTRGVFFYHASLAAPFMARAFSTYWWSVQMDIDTAYQNTRWSLVESSDLVRGRPAAMCTNKVSWFARTFDLGVELYGELTNAGFAAGTVVAGNSGAPLRNAVLTLSNAWNVITARTDNHGAYLAPAAQQTYHLHAAAARYQTALTADVAITALHTTRVDFVLWGAELAWWPTSLAAVVEIGTVITNTVQITNSGPPAATLYLAAHEPCPAAARPCYGVNVGRGSSDVRELLRFDVAAPQTTSVINASLGSEEPWGITFRNQDYSTLYGITFGKKLVRIDTATGTQTIIAPAVPGNGEYWSGIAAGTNGDLYATTSYGSTLSKLYVIDPDTGYVTPRASIPDVYIVDIAFDTNGVLYGVDVTADLLLRIDQETGAAVPVGALGFDATFDSGLACDPRDNTLYLATWDAGSTPRARFYRVNPATGAAALIGTQESGTIQLTGLAMPLTMPSAWAVPAPRATSVAPGVSDVQVLFDARGAAPGVYHAQLLANGSFVNTLPPVPLHMDVVPEPAPLAALALAALALRRWERRWERRHPCRHSARAACGRRGRCPCTKIITLSFDKIC